MWNIAPWSLRNAAFLGLSFEAVSSETALPSGATKQFQLTSDLKRVMKEKEAPPTPCQGGFLGYVKGLLLRMRRRISLGDHNVCRRHFFHAVAIAAMCS